jgi:hypothetical protein
MSAAAPEKIEAKPAAPAIDIVPQGGNEGSLTLPEGGALVVATLTLGALFTVAWIVVLAWLPGKAFGVW